MSRPSLGPMLAVVVVSLALATPWCAAAAWQKPPNLDQAVRPTASPLPELAHRLWGWLTEQWTKVGCSLDPGGRQACRLSATLDPGTYPSVGEVGCSLDPGGLECGGQ